jgi:hypothetical protein
MPSATICYYLGALFLVTAFLTQRGYRLPFNISSTPKGARWRPALLTILEDTGAIEARGELAHREAATKRYEASPLFRRTMLRLTWFWGIILMIIASVTTILIVALEERVAFGVGWGLLYVWAAMFGLWTVRFVQRSLKEERSAGGVEGIQELRHHDEINSNLYRVLGSFIRWQTSGDVSWKAEGQNTRHCGHNACVGIGIICKFLLL